ncbi:MAG: thioesterase family protein [Pirellulaceae bacterium]
MLTVFETEVRTRYQETDAQTRIHHANYITYFEIARTEMLRAAGYSYRRMEEEGLFLVVSEVECKYYQGANFDDLLRVVAKVTKAKGARIEHHYQVYRDETLLAEGRTLLGCVDPTGKPRRIPEHLRLEPKDT